MCVGLCAFVCECVCTCRCIVPVCVCVRGSRQRQAIEIGMKLQVFSLSKKGVYKG